TLEKRFPLLDFSCWSTAQVARYAHHQLARFVSFVHCERDAMAAVADALRDAGWQAHLNQTRKEAAKSFRVEERTVIIRPAISRAPVEGKYATIEKILVDLYVEAQSLPILDLGEFHRLVANLAGQERISVGTLVHYAARRKVDASDVMKGIIN
ncbi:hypothetical protein HYR69_01480, partial [Candidatus Sumerlaeota bacterium]|nr:hypothetical protein [Candidatus Sumerlaeota bacterium]